MKKIKVLLFFIFALFLVSCNYEELNKLRQENEELKIKIEKLEQENEELKEKEIQRIITSIPEKIKNLNISDAEKMLDDMMEQYGSNSEIEQAIAEEKEKLKERKKRKQTTAQKKEKVERPIHEVEKSEELEVAKSIIDILYNKISNKKAEK